MITRCCRYGEGRLVNRFYPGTSSMMTCSQVDGFGHEPSGGMRLDDTSLTEHFCHL